MPCKISLKNNASRIIVLLTVIIFFSSFKALGQASAVPDDPEIVAAGEKLFKQNCMPCHRVESKLVGPALHNVYERRELPWIYAFVKNSQKVIASGDEYANNLYEEYNKVQMTAFSSFTDDEILSIMAYIKNLTENPPQAAAPATSETVSAAGQEQAIPAKYLDAILIGAVVILIILLVVLVMISSLLSKYLRQKKDLSDTDKEYVQPMFNLGKLVRNKAFIGIVAALVTMIVLKNVIDGLYSIGVQQGYAPKQPIAFSHKIHAGDNKIDCNYCHTGVTKSKNANIPSPNICMNCHSSITKGPKTGKVEIAKIYKAVEDNKPIEWVRVHNLPDLAYFNHSQHVVVGKLACQTCHGPVEKMDVVRQYSLLTMGWCVNCHRKTPLQTKGNGYYDKLVELHKGKEPMKVVDNGGIDCAKCHY